MQDPVQGILTDPLLTFCCGRGHVFHWATLLLQLLRGWFLRDEDYHFEQFVLMFLIVLRFLHANYASLRDKQIQTLPELVLSEEMVNYAAASFRIKVNYLLLMAHDITLDKDFRPFFMVCDHNFIRDLLPSCSKIGYCNNQIIICWSVW